MAKVVIYYADFESLPEVFMEGEVEVFIVCDAVPADRIYQLQKTTIPEGMLDGPVGNLFDGSAADARIRRAVKDAIGEAPFGVIDGGKE